MNELHGYELPTYEEWRNMPTGLEKAAILALAGMWPGQYGPWPDRSNAITRDDTRRMLCEALAAAER